MIGIPGVARVVMANFTARAVVAGRQFLIFKLSTFNFRSARGENNNPFGSSVSTLHTRGSSKLQYSSYSGEKDERGRYAVLARSNQ